MRKVIAIFITALLISCSSKRELTKTTINQFPSPMVEQTRSHDRIENREYPGLSFNIKDALSKSVEVYIPDHIKDFSYIDLLIHFHGSSYVPKNAVFNLTHPIILAVVNQGHGSSVYEREFENTSTFPELIRTIIDSINSKTASLTNLNQIYFSSFSAGYGAVREIIKTHSSMIDGILLLDGMHTDYIPEKMTLAEGGRLNTAKLEGFLSFSKSAIDGTKKFIITHSEIFPGTYASLTETTDWLIDSLRLKRIPVLKWGPVGMQQISEVKKKQFFVLGFAGNSARDHVDHYHGLPEFLKMIFNN